MSQRAQSVLDYIEWHWHCDRICSLCDSTATAIAVFNCFQRTASAERGRAVELPEAVSR